MTHFIAFILLIGPLIFIHELGHLIAAKLVGVKVVRFSLGFGPPFVKLRIGETEYCLAPIPLGGYVSLLGQNPHMEIRPEDSERTLQAKPLWARFLVLGAGPLFNLLLPLPIYMAFFLNHSQATPPVIGTVLDDSAAELAGLSAGDRVLTINDTEIQSWKDLQKLTSTAANQELRVEIERHGIHLYRYVTPRKNVYKNPVGEEKMRGILGVYPWAYVPQIGVTDPQSPAYEEGLRTGDIITSINGEPIQTVEQLEEELQHSRDTSLRLTYLRPQPAQNEFASFLWFASNHAHLFPQEHQEHMGLAPANTFVYAVAEGSPAARAGIRAGDRIIAVNDQAITRWESLLAFLERQEEKPFTLTVQSFGEDPRSVSLQQEVHTKRTIYKNKYSYLWFGATPYRAFILPKPEPIQGRFTYALDAAVHETLSTLSMMWVTLRDLITLQRSMDELSSVVGVYNVAGTAAKQGPGVFLQLMALLSINLGMFNLLPIPILDGGHLLFFSIEAIRRRPLSQRAREIASACGLIIIFILLLIAIRNDIVLHWFNS